MINTTPNKKVFYFQHVTGSTVQGPFTFDIISNFFKKYPNEIQYFATMDDDEYITWQIYDHTHTFVSVHVFTDKAFKAHKRDMIESKNKFRKYPVPNTGRKLPLRKWLRYPSTQSERKSDPAYQRAKRNYTNLPTAWDDNFRRPQRSWKKHRKTQWKSPDK